jgi:catechol 2,3-dioxygenase-like lactoylglutathione lyase family enzyme
LTKSSRDHPLTRSSTDHLIQNFANYPIRSPNLTTINRRLCAFFCGGASHVSSNLSIRFAAKNSSVLSPNLRLRIQSAQEAAVLALEVVPLPVTNVDRSLTFYTERIGFILDVDYHPTPDFRVVQLTPPGSACSVHLVAAEPGSRVRNLCLVTDDLAAERTKLIDRGVAVSAIRHKEPLETWAGGWSPGLDSQRRDYASFADFADPDGNTWTLQERGHVRP